MSTGGCRNGAPEEQLVRFIPVPRTRYNAPRWSMHGRCTDGKSPTFLTQAEDGTRALQGKREQLRERFRFLSGLFQTLVAAVVPSYSWLKLHVGHLQLPSSTLHAHQFTVLCLPCFVLPLNPSCNGCGSTFGQHSARLVYLLIHHPCCRSG